MENIKDLVTRSPVLHPLNYAAHEWPIILTVGYVLMHVRDNKRPYPS
jgi:hypothetical protein